MPHALKLPPLKRLALFLSEDKADLGLLLVYTTISSLLGLSIPLAAQALINTVASGLFLQPLLILTILVFLGLTFSGTIIALEMALVEILQQRIFARLSLRLARHIPQTRLDAFGEHYPPELVNRFFDTVSVQKAIAKLFLTMPSAALQGLLAFVLMGFYSPLLLAFDAVLLGGIAILWLLGIGAVRTSIDESTNKYRVAHWLQELARCQLNFKVNAEPRFSLTEADGMVEDYLRTRKVHFRIILRQRIASLLFYALANAGILALGGWLVLQSELTLGQLVAAELMTIILLNSVDKIASSLESFYDLQTSVDKLGKLFDLPEEHNGSVLFRRSRNGATIVLRDVQYRYGKGKPVLKGLNLTLAEGAKISIVGKSGSGKTTLALLIAGLYTPNYGNVTVNGTDLRDLDMVTFRDQCSLVTDSNDLFEGTLEKNIRLNRSQVTQDDMLWALEMADLAKDLPQLEKGLQTLVTSEGKNFSEGLRQRILLARALVERPALIILDEAFNAMDENSKITVLDRLMSPEAPWTLIHMTHDLDVIARSQQVYLLQDGVITESGSPWELARNDRSHFTNCLPKLSQLLRRVPPELLLAPVKE